MHPKTLGFDLDFFPCLTWKSYLVLYIIFFSFNTVKAENSSELLQWSYFSTKIKLDKIHPKLSLRETFSPRFQSNFSELDVLLLRNEIFFKHNDNFTSSLGYDFYGVFNDDDRVENRLAEQFLYNKNLSNK